MEQIVLWTMIGLVIYLLGAIFTVHLIQHNISRMRMEMTRYGGLFDEVVDELLKDTQSKLPVTAWFWPIVLFELAGCFLVAFFSHLGD